LACIGDVINALARNAAAIRLLRRHASPFKRASSVDGGDFSMIENSSTLASTGAAGGDFENSAYDVGVAFSNHDTPVLHRSRSMKVESSTMHDAPSQYHVPYLNSKLTHFLKDSLSGPCNTVLIVTVRPSMDQYNQTLAALNFATLAAKIASTGSSGASAGSYHDKYVSTEVNKLK
jgi:hypothetical protein